MEHYDYGIFGVWSGCNYGSVATYYALNQVFESMGKSVLMIDKPIITDNDVEREDNHSRRFANEHYNISKQYRLDEFEELNDLCDGFVIGSDQVWNYGISKNFGKHFYLDFAHDDKKKIAYAVSFGHTIDFAPPEERKVISEMMDKFDGISVREADGVRICDQDYNVDAVQVLDPVFLADPKVYEPLVEKSKIKQDEPYLLTYILDPTPEKREAILHVAKELGGLKVINILDGLPWTYEKNKELMNLPNCLENVEVHEWLYHIKNAQFVITDSCHGASFAIIFKKNFIAITNKRRGFSRFKSLSDLFQFSDRLVTDPKRILTDDKLLKPMNYKLIDSIMDSERKRCGEWLDKVVNGPKLKNKLKAITRVLDKKECMGCGACVSVCPTNALSLQPDEHGYYRSTIDIDKCIKCGACVNVCPSLELPEKNNNEKPRCYAFYCADKKVLESSSSGGIFTLMAEKVLDSNGAVVGTAWGEDFRAEHIIIEKKKDLAKLQKSKYLQSYLGSVDRDVKSRLDKGQQILFTGCPCQVAGLKKYLKKDYDNLITVDLLCGNSPSAMFFKKYVDESFGGDLKAYEFRHKDKGWSATSIKATLKNGKSEIRHGAPEDDYQKVYHNHTMCPPHCENCKYQELPRFGDITIGDFWGIGKRNEKYFNKNGNSAILCNNEKGQRFIDSLPQKEIGQKQEVPVEWIGSNGYAVKGHNYCSPYRDRFYEAIVNMPFSKAVEYAFESSEKSRFRDAAKLSPLHFDVSQLHFKFDANMWEEHFINGFTVLTTKVSDPPLGNYACLTMYDSLKLGKKYKMSARFKVNTKSVELTFHIKEAGTKKFQIVHKHKVNPSDATNWVEFTKEFVANADCYSEFMVGAAQLKGNDSFLVIDYIDISPV